MWDGSNFDSSESSSLRNEARNRASEKLGGMKLEEAIEKELEMIPTDYPLRQLAEAQKRM